MHTSTILAVSSSLLWLTTAAAQSSSACARIGNPGSVGCQSNSAPTLTGGVAATADVDFQYDQGTALLTLVVTNTSPIVSGQTNPLITEISWNWPNGVSGATLQSQTGSGGTPPDFMFHYSATQSLGMGCLGDFGATLCINGNVSGIGNASAPLWPTPHVAIGPVTFVVQLSGPGVGTITASDIVAATASTGAGAAVGLKFQGGGVAGAESGFVGNGNPCCPNAANVFTIGTGCAPANVTIPTLQSLSPPVIGSPIDLGVASPSTPNAAGIMLLGFNSTFSPVFGQPLPLDLGPFGFPGCSLYSSGDFLSAIFLDGNGDTPYSTGVIPGTTPKWCGQEFTFQAFVLTANNDVISTAGLTAVMGS